MEDCCLTNEASVKAAATLTDLKYIANEFTHVAIFDRAEQDKAEPRVRGKDPDRLEVGLANQSIHKVILGAILKQKQITAVALSEGFLYTTYLRLPTCYQWEVVRSSFSGRSSQAALKVGLVYLQLHLLYQQGTNKRMFGHNCHILSYKIAHF